MYILKNAWTSIWRNKGRNILIGIIIIVIATASTITLAINNSANTLIKSYEESYEATASIEVNRESFMQNFKPGEDNTSAKETFQNITALTVDEIKSYGDSSYVSSYTYTESVGLNGSGLTKATSSTSDSGKERMGGPSGGDNAQVSTTDFTLTGYNSSEAMSEFLSGTYTITDGEISSDFTDNSCIINSELATVNGLSVGDTITLVNPNDSTKTYKLTITGIYSDSSTNNDKMALFSNSANTIITNTTMVEKITSENSSLSVTVTPTYYLTSSESADAFSEEVTNKGLDSSYKVSTNLDEAESALSSISNLKTFSVTFLIITLIIGAIVLFIINMINVRERKYEIGVLRTIGMKKSLVALQFICELLIVSLASLIIGLGIGSIASVPTANALLQNEINQSTTKMNNVSKNFGGQMPGNNNTSGSTTDSGTAPSDNGGNNNSQDMHIQGVANVQKVTSIHAVVNWVVILELLGVGLLLTLISSLAAVGSIMRFSPLTILKERS